MDLAQMTALPRQARNAFGSLVSLHLAETGDRVPSKPRAWFQACATVWHARSEVFAFLRSGDLTLANELRQRFGLGVPLSAAQVIPDNLFETEQPDTTQLVATIVIPIYNAAERVVPLLARLPATLSENQSVILVDDGSTDPLIDKAITSFADIWPSTKIIRFGHNQGFVHAVNAAFSRVPTGDHVILLNSDTVPPKNWVPRLLAPFASAHDIASVTPLSNAAEVLSVPIAGLAGAPTPSLIEAMDAVAKRLRQPAVTLPTGIGFCMALNRRFLDQAGFFDRAFGTGYGEEVDWCQRVRALGGRHAVATNLVVGHHGAASFGEAQRRQRIASANQIIDRRYPEYQSDVSAWVANTPIAPERLAISIGWAAHETTHSVPLFIAHSLGGGAETALQEEIAKAQRNGLRNALVLRVGGPSAWRVELHDPEFKLIGDVNETSVVHALLEPLEHRHVVYSCAVHASDPEAVPETILHLAKGHRLSVRMHDFFPISPSWNLLGTDGTYRGVPPLTTQDPAHALQPANGRPELSHADWRSRWGKVMDAADEVMVFSRSGGVIVETAYPQVQSKIAVRPHAVTRVPPRLRSGGQTLGVLGGINHAKGGTVLYNLARVWNRRIAIIGELDGRFTLPTPHIVHGRYTQNEIAALARKYDVGAWLIPSVCPETFSFVTHETLATGLPVACFNLGAQAETLAAATSGHVLDLNPNDTSAIAAKLDQLFEMR